MTNDLDVIDGVSVKIPDEKGLGWSATPALLALFPEGTGRIDVELTVSATYPAGRHVIPIELCSSVDPATTRVELALVVPEVPGGTVVVEPPVRTGRREARYRVRFENTGNTALEVDFAGSEAARAVQASFVSSRLPVSPGSSTTSPMRVRGKRRFFGGDVSHQLTVLATAGELEAETKAVFRQRPLVPRGARTFVILGTIVALWAAIFAIVLSRAFSKDPLTKQVPASFYASLPKAAHGAKLQSLGGGSAVGLAAASSAAPAGAVPKSGVVIGVGGAISGKVVAKSTGSGIGRINVEALEEGPKGLTTVASAATASDGTYAIDGLLPGSYKILFEAQGFQRVYYPGTASASGAKTVTVDALATTRHVDGVVAGLPGTISGAVHTGETPSPPVTVTVQPQQGASTTPVATVKTNAAGAYKIPNLPTPGQYDLSFSAKGFQVASTTDQLGGGQSLIADTVTLSASSGSISGVVTAGGKPLGGVSITAQGGGKTFTSATPTTGAVGHFSLIGLPSPATYLLTFTDGGYGTRIVGEKLGPGASLSDVKVALQGGAGEISGTVASTAGTALGGVTVTVEGGASPVTTQTLTAGTVGAYDLSGLATPGRYTLTFSLDGYQSQTVAVPLSSSGSAHGIDVKLPPEVGTITGTVASASGTPLSGVSVTATNGTTTTKTKSTSQPAGGFLLTGLAPGDYSVTFSVTGYTQQTYLVKLAPGASSSVQAKLSAKG